MAKNTDKRRATDFNLPRATGSKNTIQLPFNGKKVEKQGFSFSFSCLDRHHELFNLGGNDKDGTVGGEWFLRLLDCLKSVSSKTVDDLRKSTHKLHPINWKNANVKPPNFSEQADYWQFRIDKTHGRVIGILIDSVFYIVWLDPYHNLIDSEGYGGVNKFPEPKL